MSSLTDKGSTSAPTSDLHAWHILSPLMVQGGYLPWTSGSMRPAALVTVCNEIVHGGRTRIVECGSGASTLMIARLLRERGSGSVIALEHDDHWASLVNDLLYREGLDSIGRVLHAPLEGEPPWYDLGGLVGVPEEVDLLIVDGPPAFDPGHDLRRAPALPWFEERLVAGASVLLDDVNRHGEQEVLAGWEKYTDWRFEIDEDTGLASGSRNSTNDNLTPSQDGPDTSKLVKLINKV